MFYVVVFGILWHQSGNDEKLVITVEDDFDMTCNLIGHDLCRKENI